MLTASAGDNMRGKGEIMADLAKSVETWDMELVQRSVNEAIEAGISPSDIIKEGLGKGMEEISRMFDEAKVFLPQVVAASKAMELALKILEPCMKTSDIGHTEHIVIGSVKGDIHEIGKNVCAAMLRGSGYIVIDIGTDSSVDEFLEKAREVGAPVVAASALMTTTLTVQKELVNEVNKEGLTVKVLVGGAPCSQQWADEIGADGYSASGAEIVSLAKRVLDE